MKQQQETPDMGQEAMTLLAWYDRAARQMPWRVSPGDRASGKRPDPYYVWLSEVMLQQTTVAAVTAYFNRFVARWPRVDDLAAAEDDAVMGEWAGLGYYARARNLLKCARAVTAQGGFPTTEAELMTLPGIGPYTAAAIASIAFDEPAVVMDGNVERVMARRFAETDPLPDVKPELKTHAASLTPQKRPGDYAQAVMDLGATICTPRNPSCMICPWSEGCRARELGIAADLPRKRPKPEKPTRLGHIYVARRSDGAVLLERRPEKGLLGGMMGFPGSDWSEMPPEPAPPAEANWTQLDSEVTHVFTHFRLVLTVHVAILGAETRVDRGHFVDAVEFSDKALPTVMRKAFRIAQEAWAEGTAA